MSDYAAWQAACSSGHPQATPRLSSLLIAKRLDLKAAREAYPSYRVEAWTERVRSARRGAQSSKEPKAQLANMQLLTSR
jgi:hypothetical protein